METPANSAREEPSARALRRRLSLTGANFCIFECRWVADGLGINRLVAVTHAEEPDTHGDKVDMRIAGCDLEMFGPDKLEGQHVG